MAEKPHTNHTSERSRLERAGTLHWFHWAIVGLSLALTIFAWSYSKKQLEEKVAIQFDREAQQALELIEERMQKYEDALWAGVAFIETVGGDVDFETWREYATDIHIEEKYPGINGIGVIHSMSCDEGPAYLQRMRHSRPDFHIYPEHAGDEFWPISYIIPVDENFKAVGLDMAHEENRYTAATRARDTGTAQITGPITLVQDATHTPGFLFYAPIYTGANEQAEGKRRDSFAGLVYAPFVVRELMEGTLGKENRHVGISIRDGSKMLYDEHVSSEPDFDSDPLYKQITNVDLFGRTWEFDIWSTKDFRTAAASREPLTILFGGLFIDALLLGLFLLISRSSRKALQYADAVTAKIECQAIELREANLALAQSNSEMEQFVYAASHDLKSPMISVLGSLGFLKRAIAQDNHEKIAEHSARIEQSVKRMWSNVDDLLQLSRVGRSLEHKETIDTGLLAGQLVAEMQDQIDNAGATVTICPNLPAVASERVRLTQVLQNLLSNALAYGRSPDGTLDITIGGERTEQEIRLFVADRGPGVPDEDRENVFNLFIRLTHDQDGTGVGLAIVKRVAEIHGGRVWIEQTVGGGATFIVSFPSSQPHASVPLAA